MKLSIFLASLVATFLLVACVQPAAAPAATTTTGLQIMEPWARQARMTGGAAMSSDTAASSTAMSMTTRMTATDPMSSMAMSAAPMTTTASISATEPMSGTMGMGMGGAMGAMYMTIRNPGNRPDRLIKAQSDVSQVVELHNMAMKDGVMSMYPVEAIEIPANGEAVLKPGGFHVMLIGLNRDLLAGETMTVTLTFEQAGEITLQAPIRER